MSSLNRAIDFGCFERLDAVLQLANASLNVVGAASYILVAATCFFAWLSTRTSSATAAGWPIVGAFFVLLAASRLLEFEDAIRDVLREFLRDRGSYESRQFFQVLALAFAGLITFVGAFWIRRSTSFNRRSLFATPLRVAFLVCGIMLALIVARIVSLHAIDALLYGELKLNWFIDLGCAFAVAGSAAWAIKAEQRSR